jgi:hypothetical protein
MIGEGARLNQRIRGGGIERMSRVERPDNMMDIARLGNNESARRRIEGKYPACSAVGI